MMAPLGGVEPGSVARIGLHWRPDLGRRRGNIFKPARHYRDYFVAIAVKRDSASDDSAIPAKMPLPEAVAQNHYFRTAKRVVRRLKIPSRRRWRSEHAEIGRAYALPFQPFRPLRSGHPRPPRLPPPDVIE